MADANDISDVQSQLAGGNTQNTAKTLPIRGEKRILPVTINPTSMNDTFNQAYSATGKNSPQDAGYAATGRTNLVEYSDFYVHATLKPFVDYVTVRLLNRGQSAAGTPDPTTNATYRFLINPNTVQISRQTLDAQAFARAGWQFGVWGEDFVQITLNGKTAGQYWAFGLTDRYLPYSQSYRNLEQLQVVFENNGYWFEGEQTAEGPLAADFARRRIKMHQDVELTVGNFIWSGMFESLEISQNAESPFLMDFNLSFVSWKERYRPSSPITPQIKNDLQRGNAYSVYAATQAQAAKPSTSQPTTQQPPSPTPTGLAAPATPNVNPLSPAVAVCSEYVNFPSTPASTADYVPVQTPAVGGVAGTGTVSLLTGGK